MVRFLINPIVIVSIATNSDVLIQERAIRWRPLQDGDSKGSLPWVVANLTAKEHLAGTTFNYNSAITNVLGRAIRNSDLWYLSCRQRSHHARVVKSHGGQGCSSYQRSLKANKSWHQSDEPSILYDQCYYKLCLGTTGHVIKEECLWQINLFCLYMRQLTLVPIGNS